ncbi:metallophosphoesterase family protein [Enterovibrio coralii]|uniref:Calcineurin-like phosphoesterase domain-containing protein n=1 Tax=Enterovibrio coralii TaxID=294935 RepID=A0A135I8U5_9GAMM|nr:metallophosphoesterase family protein [Enterovibrio coralii]KXF81870.1 hypothetical protein ATN88_20485 [Enterovibrio coralii]
MGLYKQIDATLAQERVSWLSGNKHALRQRKKGKKALEPAIRNWVAKQSWKWPKRPIIFITDLHADADAFWASLVASGGIEKKEGSDDFSLTPFGKSATFVFGGDFFDKGPSNLALLRALKLLFKKRARVRLLAGNHDIRVLFGMTSVDMTDDPRNGHFFIRMGAKAVPFLREIKDEYLSHDGAMNQTPDKQTCLDAMLPSDSWWEQFPDLAKWSMPNNVVEREVRKIHYKSKRFAQVCEKEGLTVREAYAAARCWQSLFMEKGGEFYWFFQRLRLVMRKGSLLFTHAGIDDRTAAMLEQHGTGYINKEFRRQILGNPFEFYYGPLSSMIRTKYRSVDMPLTPIGSKSARRAGILAIVHGHRNLHRGQRIAMRKNLLHFECDITLDCNSRRKEGLKSKGFGATLIEPQGTITGISSDHSKIKVFSPQEEK